MINFKFSSYKVLLALGLGLASSFAWSQAQESPLVMLSEGQEPSQNSSQETNQNINADYVPIIFDPVLIQTVELSETDDNGELRFDTIELSSLPSTINSAPQTSSNIFQLDQERCSKIASTDAA